MKRDLRSIYFDVLDRIHLNSNIKQNSKTLKVQLLKDEELKQKIESVFENPLKYDVYYYKPTLELKIIELAEGEEKGTHNAFNRIDIIY